LFQVNTFGAELLYSTIKELAAPDEKTTVLDICCGTGTIGISMAKVQQSFGFYLNDLNFLFHCRRQGKS
jgi:tRNA/tmRNA/rRNA uracil-C5-methylase (TrmA/RlmC/RlmD family)